MLSYKGKTLTQSPENRFSRQKGGISPISYPQVPIPSSYPVALSSQSLALAPDQCGGLQRFKIHHKKTCTQHENIRLLSQSPSSLRQPNCFNYKIQLFFSSLTQPLAQALNPIKLRSLIGLYLKKYLLMTFLQLQHKF